MLRCHLVQTLARASSHRLGGSGSGVGGVMLLPPTEPPSFRSPWVPLGLKPGQSLQLELTEPKPGCPEMAPPQGSAFLRPLQPTQTPCPGSVRTLVPVTSRDFPGWPKEGHEWLAQELGLWKNRTALPFHAGDASGARAGSGDPLSPPQPPSHAPEPRGSSGLEAGGAAEQGTAQK